jgi:hypothetical protein
MTHSDLDGDLTPLYLGVIRDRLIVMADILHRAPADGLSSEETRLFARHAHRLLGAWGVAALSDLTPVVQQIGDLIAQAGAQGWTGDGRDAILAHLATLRTAVDALLDALPGGGAFWWK